MSLRNPFPILFLLSQTSVFLIKIMFQGLLKALCQRNEIFFQAYHSVMVNPFLITI